MTRALLLAFLLLALPAQADVALTAHGKALAEKNCTTCHAVGVSGDSPLRDAPPFRDLAANYDEGELEDAFNDGVVTEHPAMPDWQMTPEQAAALASYIMSLAPHGMKKTEAQQ
jgi:cytochrome c